MESDVEQIREGVDYLAEQLQADTTVPRRRIGFGADDDVNKPYGMDDRKGVC